MTTRRGTPVPDPDQHAAWRHLFATSSRQQRARRGKRKRGIDPGSGMIRRPPPDHPAPGGAAKGTP